MTLFFQKLFRQNLKIIFFGFKVFLEAKLFINSRKN
ncbi:Hypothetical Protein SLY_0502 [Strawberry lethal yellows phytoplasma (CPA) str. NZSb11]|uniref:Uncharacterized protein n=1 Tax=Strawberry lethal yellows phytoplasma (CPA) str. NZSb11 TaxID=980422 RepID=R4S104_PHYAS|nr:Hypothetical Protein SLY_0502 [Strawberry lethal yellows phytoplasma (CPA) str. NZSb11]